MGKQRKQQILKYEIFVGERPLEELTPQEREDFVNRTVERMGNALNNYYSCHPQEWVKLCKSLDEIEKRREEEHARQ